MNNKGTMKKSYSGEMLSSVGNELTETIPKHRKTRVKHNRKSDHKHIYVIGKEETIDKKWVKTMKICTICDRQTSNNKFQSLYLVNNTWCDIGWNPTAVNGYYNFKVFNFETQKLGWKNINEEIYDKSKRELDERIKEYYKLYREKRGL